MSDPILTILTCTYNRKVLLGRLFESIVASVGCSDGVEWLVVDDGSRDDTIAYLDEIKNSHPELVRVVEKENGGKCSAMNAAAPFIRGGWVMVVDSDDVVLPGALRGVLRQIQERRSEEVGMLAGLIRVAGAGDRKFYVEDNPCRYTEWVSGQGQFDFTPVIRVDLFRSYPYPLATGEKYMAESWRYEIISKKCLTYFVNEFWVSAEYLPDGLSADSLRLRMNSPINAMVVYLGQYCSVMRTGLRWRAAVNYWRFSLHALRMNRPPLEGVHPPFLWAAFGLAAFLIDLLRSGK